MIVELSVFTYTYEIIINFVSHFLIFIGTFYVALQNRNLKQWHITPLWYVGLASLFTCITIVCQWAVGPEFPLSYWNLGRVSEILGNIAVATVAVIMLSGTLRKDLKEAKKRRHRLEI